MWFFTLIRFASIMLIIGKGYPFKLGIQGYKPLVQNLRGLYQTASCDPMCGALTSLDTDICLPATKKYVFVTGGVISGVGKGVTASSIGLVLKMLGCKPTMLKIDPYLNIDAGTM
jgi:hypothetical protein